MRIKDITIFGMLSALLLAVQYVLSFVPNVELVTLLIIIYTCTFRKNTAYIITVFLFLEGFLYGFGLWWFNYLYVWFILFFIALKFKKERSRFFWAIVSGGYGLSFGALCAVLYFFMGLVNGGITTGINSAFAYWITGIPFDIIHGISNFFVAFVLFKPLLSIISQLNQRSLTT